MQAEGLILAGGWSTRMGGNHKGSLIYRGEAFTQILIKELKRETSCVRISYGRKIKEDWGCCPAVMDIYPDCGPIGGIHAGLSACLSEWLLVAACDMPFLKIDLFCFLMDRIYEMKKKGVSCEGAVPVSEGRIHPLAAVYKKGIEKIFEEQIQTGSYGIRDTLKRLNILYVDLTKDKIFKQMMQNINTAEDYERLIENEWADIKAGTRTAS